MECTRCDGTGFLNLHQVDDETLDCFEAKGDVQVIFDWINRNSCHDVGVCDCCGTGDTWHDEPGRHNPHNPNDPMGCR